MNPAPPVTKTHEGSNISRKVITFVCQRQKAAILVVRLVHGCAFVFHLGNVRRDAEPVCKAGWNEDLALVLCRELHGCPERERRGPTPDVHRDVERTTANYTKQLALRTAQLIMQPANRALHGRRMVVLHEGRRNPGLRISLRMVALEEEPAGIREHAGLDDYDARKCRGDRLHPSSSRIARRYWPYGLPCSAEARCSTWAASMNPIRQATSSIAPTFRP